MNHDDNIKIECLMKNLILLSFLFCGFLACQGQESQTQKQKNEKTTTTQSPNGDWTVHEEYDDDGNLISRDSTYSYSYSSINGQKVSPEEMDSLFSQLHGHFNGKTMQDMMQGLNGMDMDDFMQNFGDMSLNELMEGFGGMDLSELMQDFDENFFADSTFFNDEENEDREKDSSSFHQKMMEQAKKMQEQFFQQHSDPNQRVIPRETPDSKTDRQEQSKPEKDINLKQV